MKNARTNDEELVARVAELMKAQDDALDPRLEAFAAGRETEAAARQALAGRDDAEAVLAALRPLGAEFREATLERVLRCRPQPASEQPRVISLSSHRGRLVRWLGAAVVASAAAAGLVLVLRPGTPALPRYADTFVGGDVLVRGGPDTTAADAPGGVLRPDSKIEWVMRPVTAVSGEVEVRGFIVAGGVGKRWPLAAEISAQGAVRIAGRVTDLGIPLGASRLVVSVGRPGTLPDYPPAIDRPEALVHDSSQAIFWRSVVVKED
jgi:hypothetical protein